ncbi:MAG: hypothetical protein ABI533_02800 [Betaproteobacteria bacterium]
MTALPGRLNLFQRTMLDWRDWHPYVAVHAVRIDRPLDRAAATRAIDETLTHGGLTGLVLDRAAARYQWRGGAASTTLEVVEAGADWQATLAGAFERQLNLPFVEDGAMDPFRFFALDLGDAFFLGCAYDHFVAGGDSIIVLLNAIADRYAGHPPQLPLSLYPPTHRRLVARNPLRFIRGLGRLPAMAASCRRTIRPRFRPAESHATAFTFFTLDRSEFAALRSATKHWRVTINDALMALLLLAQDSLNPDRDRGKSRHELAVASIINLRDAHGEDVRTTFGQFLSSFRVSHPVPAGIDLETLARDVHAATSRIKREKLYLTTLGAIAVDRVVGHFRTPAERINVYARSYPVGAGVSLLNVNVLWRNPDGSPAPMYIRGVPTGPASPLVVAVTTSGETLCAGVTYRTSSTSADDILRIQTHLKTRIHALK